MKTINIIPNIYQKKALLSLGQKRKAMWTKACVIMPPSTGKTFLAIMDARNSGAEKILYLTHKDCIFNQVKKSAMEFFDKNEVGLFRSSSRDVSKKFTIATIQSLTNKNKYMGIPRDFFDYIILDEFHHGKAKTWQEISDWFTPSRFKLFLTATPSRLDNKNIFELCDFNVAFSKNFQDAEKDGFVPYVQYTAINGDEYYQEEQFIKILKENKGKKGLIFCSSTNHADILANRINNYQITDECYPYHSKLRDKTKVKTFEEFNKGKINLMTCVDMLSEGVSIRNIDFIILLRRTDSPVVFWQSYSRLYHSSEKKVRAYDFVKDANLERFYELFDIDIEMLFEAIEREVILGDKKLKLFPWIETDAQSIDINIHEYIKARILKKLVMSYERFKRKFGRRPTEEDFNKKGKFVIKYCEYLFGSFDKFVISKKEVERTIEKSIFDIYYTKITTIEKELGRELRLEEMTKYGIEPGIFYWMLQPRAYKICDDLLTLEQKTFLINLKKMFGVD